MKYLLNSMLRIISHFFSSQHMYYLFGDNFARFSIFSRLLPLSTKDLLAKIVFHDKFFQYWVICHSSHMLSANVLELGNAQESEPPD